MPLPSTVLLRTQSDERLVALARAGHERAFEAIVVRYRRPLVRACRRVLGEARAEDAVQRTLMAAWTALRRGDEVRELRPWLYRIAQNTALNELRAPGYDYEELDRLLRGGPGSEAELEARLVARRTLAGIAALPPRQRDALLQIAVEGRGQEEVARALGVSEPAVRQLVHRARTRLRAAATALTPMPLAGWMCGTGGVAGSAGAASTAAKVGAAVVLASGAAAGPALLGRFEHGGGHAPHAIRARVVPPSPAARPRRAAAHAAPSHTPAPRATAAPAGVRPAVRHVATSRTAQPTQPVIGHRERQRTVDDRHAGDDPPEPKDDRDRAADDRSAPTADSPAGDEQAEVEDQPSGDDREVTEEQARGAVETPDRTDGADVPGDEEDAGSGVDRAPPDDGGGGRTGGDEHDD